MSPIALWVWALQVLWLVTLLFTSLMVCGIYCVTYGMYIYYTFGYGHNQRFGKLYRY